MIFGSLSLKRSRRSIILRILPSLSEYLLFRRIIHCQDCAEHYNRGPMIFRLQKSDAERN